MSLLLWFTSLCGVITLFNWWGRTSYKAGVTAGYCIGLYRNDPKLDKMNRLHPVFNEAVKIIDSIEAELVWECALNDGP